VRGRDFRFRGPHSSGHCYFALKDESAKIEAVIWKGVHGRMRFKPQEGLEVIATGKLTTYPGSSKYQIVIERSSPPASGALMALMEERKKKLAAEGCSTRRQATAALAAGSDRRRHLAEGAVIRDILHRLQDRFRPPGIGRPVKVQARARRTDCGSDPCFNALPEAGRIPRRFADREARGGGSLEDLWSSTRRSWFAPGPKA